MIAKGRPVPPVTHDARLDGDAARPICQQPSGRDTCRPAAPEGGASSVPPGSTLQAAGFLCCGQCLRDERLGTTRTASVADTPNSDTDIIVGGHGAEMREVRKVSTFQEVARIDRLSLLVAPRAKCLTCLRFSADRPPRTSRLLSPVGRLASRAWPHYQTSENVRQSAKNGQTAHYGLRSDDLGGRPHRPFRQHAADLVGLLGIGALHHCPAAEDVAVVASRRC